MSAFLKTCTGETHFILRTPEERNETEEQEKAYLQNVNASPYVLMLVCTVDGEIAGTCSLMFNNHKKQSIAPQQQSASLKNTGGSASELQYFGK